MCVAQGRVSGHDEREAGEEKLTKVVQIRNALEHHFAKRAAAAKK